MPMKTREELHMVHGTPEPEDLAQMQRADELGPRPVWRHEMQHK